MSIEIHLIGDTTAAIAIFIYTINSRKLPYRCENEYVGAHVTIGDGKTYITVTTPMKFCKQNIQNIGSNESNRICINNNSDQES